MRADMVSSTSRSGLLSVGSCLVPHALGSRRAVVLHVGSLMTYRWLPMHSIPLQRLSIVRGARLAAPETAVDGDMP